MSEEELYKCSCGHIQKINPHITTELSKGIICATCPSCSKGIIIFKCKSCDHACMVEARTVEEVEPGVFDLTCSKCDKTNRYKAKLSGS